MLQKSKRSALVLSLITVASFSLMTAVMDIALPYWLTGDITTIVSQPELLSQPDQLAGLFIFITFMLALLVLVGWVWLYKFFSEEYFGRRGALHWALFGGLLGLFIALPGLLFGERWPLLQQILRYASPFPAFFLARYLTGIKRNYFIQRPR